MAGGMQVREQSHDLEKTLSNQQWDWRDQAQTWFTMIVRTRPSHAISLIRRISYCFVPQLLRSHIFDDKASTPKQFSTSYLNGLRGITALKVFTFHYMMVFTDATHEPWGTDPRHTYFVQLPIIRYFWSGFTSHIFFGLAGYLTSLRLFQLLDKNEVNSQAKVLMSISGSLFRRAFRLYIPVFIITLIMTTYIHYGFYESNRALLLDHERLFPGDWNEPKPPMFDTWSEQLRFWNGEMWQLSNLVSPYTFYPDHDQHLWSILSEMRASLHLYGCLIALAQVKRPVRLALLCVLVGVYFWWNHWEIWVYILGAVVAQIDQILTEKEQARKAAIAQQLPLASHIHRESSSDDEDFSEKAGLLDESEGNRNIIRDILNIITPHSIMRTGGFLVAFYWLSYPIHGSRDPAPGYEMLNSIIPEWMERKEKFYMNFGTFLFLLLLVRSNPETSKWRKLCSHHLPQYMGKISFGFYLTQVLVMHSFGYLVPHHVWWSFGTSGMEVNNAGWICGIFIGWVITLTTTLWVADCWVREVEGRCIKVVKWFETLCFR